MAIKTNYGRLSAAEVQPKLYFEPLALPLLTGLIFAFWNVN